MISWVPGLSSAASFPTRMEAAVCSSVAPPNRFCSLSVRANARITRTPDRFSRSTRVSLSSRPCTVRYSGTVLRITRVIISTNSGIATIITSDSRRSMVMAMTIPPTHKNGARITSRISMATAYWS